MPRKTIATRKPVRPPKPNLDAQLIQLETAQLVRRVGEEVATYIFKHVLVQDTAYHSLLQKQRREIHRRVARAYEAEYGNQCLDDYAGILAQHYAEAGDHAQTLVYARRAGDLAARVYANAEAITFYTQAINAAKHMNATTEQFIHLYTKRGRVLEVMGNMEALATYEEMTEFAHAQNNRELELQALLLRGTLHATPSTAFDRAKALALADAANQLACDLNDRKAQAHTLWNQLLIYLYSGEIPDAIRYGEQALALARELQESELLGYILGDLARAYLQIGQVTKATALTRDADLIWRSLDNKPMLADALMQSAMQALLQGDYDQTIALTNEGIEISQSIGSKISLMANRGTQIFPLIDRGEFRRALQLTKGILRMAHELNDGNYPMQSAFAALICGFLGAFKQGNEIAEYAEARLHQPLPGFFRTWAWVMLARYYLMIGKLDAAGTALAESQVANKLQASDPTSIFGVIAYGEYLLAHNDLARTVQVMANRVTRLRQLGIQQSLPEALWIQARALRALGKTEQAIELLHQARVVAEGMQARRLLWQIYAMLSEIEKVRGNTAESEMFNRQAREVIGFIVDHTPPEFRESFLNLPNVRKTMVTNES